jgi:hypothetical protein
LPVVAVLLLCCAPSLRADHTAASVLLFEDPFDRPDSLTVGNGWQEHGEAFPQEMRISGGDLVVELLHNTAPGFPFTGVSHVAPDYVTPWRYAVRMRVDALGGPVSCVTK